MIKTVTIGDLGRIITGNTPPRSKPELYGYHTPFIKATDISEGNKYTLYPEECYSKEGYNKYLSSLIPKGATCVVTIGSIGKKMTMAHCDCFINQAMNAIIPNDKFDSEYVYYAVKNIIGNLKSLDSGTASGRENVSKSAFSKMSISVEFDKTIQTRIGQILASYDDLINNNKHQIKLLEEVAQRLYKEWFVDLRFPGFENTPIIDGVPQGWKQKTVQECLAFHGNGGWGKESITGKNTHPGRVIRGTDINDIKIGHFGDIPTRYHSDNDIKSRILKPYDLVFELSNGNINNIGRCLFIDDLILEICGENTICASFCKLLRPLDELHALILYSEIQNMQESGRMLPFKKQGANGINNFDFDGFLNHMLLIPNNENLINIIKMIMSRISILQGELSLLIETRDRLLPKLINGEIEV